MTEPVIGMDNSTKVERHENWILTLKAETFLVYNHESKNESGIVSSTWIFSKSGWTLFEGCCQIGQQREIQNGEIHVIQKGCTALRKMGISNQDVRHCVDNQNAIRGLAGGPSARREYIRECLKEVKILPQGCGRIKGKWTPLHQNIAGNEQADTLAKAGKTVASCGWKRGTRSWLRSAPYHNMINQWHALNRE